MTSPRRDLPELDVARIRRYVEARIPAHAAGQIRLELEVRGSSVTIVETRPPWRPDYGPAWSRQPIAQLRYDPSRREWTLYWHRASGRWQRYEGVGPAAQVEPLLAEIEADPSAAFWG